MGSGKGALLLAFLYSFHLISTVLSDTVKMECPHTVEVTSGHDTVIPCIARSCDKVKGFYCQKLGEKTSVITGYNVIGKDTLVWCLVKNATVKNRDYECGIHCQTGSASNKTLLKVTETARSLDEPARNSSVSMAVVGLVGLVVGLVLGVLIRHLAGWLKRKGQWSAPPDIRKGVGMPATERGEMKAKSPTSY
ncbi:hypothetical protein AGOR_G00222680 [Albula goreensis]|uniref:Uncharacterized protein n=1 Tax=Albula goreensis TaxID=1534307 RepID=A0A8T3CNF6_9TELE|nr:hypothetical protein AGOR_G00222680 [Albula goreensis]